MNPIRLDYTNTLADVIGPERGLGMGELEAMAGASRDALARVQARRGKDLRWLDLPHERGYLRDIQAFADSVQGRFENVCVLGIGGSALGNSALHTALDASYHDLFPTPGKPRLFVLDNIDPEWIAEFLAKVDPSKTLFNVISKSGGTAETMSQFLILREKLEQAVGSAAVKEHLVVTTDAEKGVLREICDREGYTTFPVPDGVGGRFSVLSPVGLLPACLIGIDGAALLDGAAAMDERCRAESFFENPAQVYAALQTGFDQKRRMPIAVTLAYSHRLRNFADWYAQLLAESIGKRTSTAGQDVFVGPTPVRAVGVTDQHSQVQLYVEGPFDKWFTLLAVDEIADPVKIPKAFGDLEGAAYLGGRTLHELFVAEREGTRIALTEAGRPNCSLHFPRVDAHTVGQYIALMEISVALMGEHYGINAFDQPGVEAGKVAAYALMGRAGYEARRQEIEQAGKREARIV